MGSQPLSESPLLIKYWDLKLSKSWNCVFPLGNGVCECPSTERGWLDLFLLEPCSSLLWPLNKSKRPPCMSSCKEACSYFLCLPLCSLLWEEFWRVLRWSVWCAERKQHSTVACREGKHLPTKRCTYLKRTITSKQSPVSSCSGCHWLETTC